MWTPPSLIEYYDYIVVLQQPTSVVMKLSVLAGLVLMAREPGALARQLLTLIFAAHFLSAAFLSMGGGGGTRIIMLLSFALAVICGVAALKGPPDWRVMPEGETASIATVFGYFLLITFPFWPMLDGVFRSLVFSPMGILPHQTVGVLLLLLALGGTRHRGALSLAAILMGLLTGLLDLIWAYGLIGGLLLAGSIVTAFRVYPRELRAIVLSPEEPVSADKEPDRPRARRSEEEAPQSRSETPKKKTGNRKWDL